MEQLPMTEAERLDAFKKSVAELEQRYGFTVAATVMIEQVEQEIKLRPQLVIAPITGWQPPTAEQK